MRTNVRRKVSGTLLCIALAALCACGGQQALVDMETAEGDGCITIVWEDRTYAPFCVVSKQDCGKQIGYVDGNREDRVCQYKDLAPEEWIASYLTMDGGAMLWKEAGVESIPDGLESEYDW